MEPSASVAFVRMFANDAIQIATAFTESCPILITTDGDRKPGKRKKFMAMIALDKRVPLKTGVPLRILTPKGFITEIVEGGQPLTAGVAAMTQTEAPVAERVALPAKAAAPEAPKEPHGEAAPRPQA